MSGGAGLDHGGDGGARVAPTHERLAHEDGVGAGRDHAAYVVGAGDAGLGHGHRVGGQGGGDALEGAVVDLEGLEVAGVDADERGADVEGALHLGGVVDLDEDGEAEPAGLGVEVLERRLVETGDDEQHEVGAGGAGLPQLVGRDDEVLAQHRDGDLLAHDAQVVERAAEAALLGQHADDGRAPGLVLGGQRGGVGDVGQVALARRLALDLADDADAGRGERRHRVERRRGVGDEALQLGQRRGLLAGGEVDTHPLDDLVEDGHD